MQDNSGSDSENNTVKDTPSGSASNAQGGEGAQKSESLGSEPLDAVAQERRLRDADFSAFDQGELAEDGEGSNGSNTAADTANNALKEMEQKYLRALADFENFKKRSLKERSDLLKYQGEKVFIDLLGVVDNFDRALENAQAEPAQLREGVELIHRMFDQVLAKWDVKSEAAVGTPFDPNKHEAISQMPSEEHPPGTVVNELEKAFYYKDKLIRPAKVVVSLAAEGKDSTDESETLGEADSSEEA